MGVRQKFRELSCEVSRALKWSLILMSPYRRYHNFLYFTILERPCISLKHSLGLSYLAFGLSVGLHLTLLTHRQLLTKVIDNGSAVRMTDPNSASRNHSACNHYSRPPTDYGAPMSPVTYLLLFPQSTNCSSSVIFSAYSQVSPDLYLNMLFLSCILYHKFRCLSVQTSPLFKAILKFNFSNMLEHDTRK